MTTQATRLGSLACLILLLTSITPLAALGNQATPPAPLAAFHYHTYEEFTAELQTLAQQYPLIMNLTSAGKTYEGRNLWLVKLSRNVSTEEQEPNLLFMGTHHGNEKPAYEVLLFFIHSMTENYTRPGIEGDRVRAVLNSTQIFLIPMVNPDGVELDSRKNNDPNHGPFGKSKDITSYGVNLNRNYADPWYLYYLLPRSYGCVFCLADSSFNYHGPYPFSENETKAVKSVAEAHRFTISISYHTYGQFIVYPWMHTSKPTPDESTFISLGENISRINSYELDTGHSYKIPRYGGTLGTSENYLYRNFGTYAFTIELCAQRAPTDPGVMYRTCLAQTEVHLYLCERALTLPSARILQQ
jgi:hypothetical protein